MSFTASTPQALRPLSIGELFDRAITLYFKHMLTFAAILFVATVPLALISFLQVYLERDLLDFYAGLWESLLKNPSAQPDISKLSTLSTSSGVIWASALSGINLLIALFVMPLANGAVVSGVSRAYLGLPVRFRECYNDALKRWGYVVLLTLLWFVVLIILLIPTYIAMLLLVLAIAGLAVVGHTVGLVLGALIGIAFVLALVAFVIMGYMAFASSFIACMLERIDPVAAFVVGIKRIFGAGMFWRSLLVAFFILLVFFGFGLVAAFFALLTLYLTRNWFLYLTIAHVLNIFYVAFAFVLVSLYYYDIRIRREGFDIQLLAAQLGATSGGAVSGPAPQ